MQLNDFSILKRIETSATLLILENYTTLKEFQYPQSDRDLCNRSSPIVEFIIFFNFSILNRIETSATRLARTRYALHYALSVSSIGSRPLQQPITSFVEGEVARFQYPQADRPLCNLHRGHPRTWISSLSVFSSGSRPLQL